jgi:GMP synthase (glutamine-hydrolysing)
MSAHLLVVEHEAGCPPDRFGPWLTAAGARLEVLRPYAGDRLPPRPAADGVVVLGGSMGAYDDARAPWLPAVRSLLQAAVDARVPTLGICLGAQLLAAATGGRVERGADGVEAGIVDARFRPAASDDPLLAGLPDPFPGPSMHDDAIVALPPGAVWLGSTPRYPHQIFRVGPAAWGVQFHPEISPETFRRWAAAHPHVTAEHVEQAERRDPDVVAAGRALADRFAIVAAGRSPRPVTPPPRAAACRASPGSRP